MYQLQKHERILYRGNVELLPNWKQKKKMAFRSVGKELILTNYNIILNDLMRKEFEEMDMDVYAISTIKTYQGIPQVLRKGVYVEMCFTGKELFLNFPNKKEGENFVNAVFCCVENFKLDSGTITQDEFEKLKQECIG